MNGKLRVAAIGVALSVVAMLLLLVVRPSLWFPWAYVGADHITDVANDAGLGEVEIWTVDGRWFASVGGSQVGAERTAVAL